MNPDSFAKLTGLFEQLVELPIIERMGFLEHVSAGDEKLRKQLLMMLKHDDEVSCDLSDQDIPLRSMIDLALMDRINEDRIPESIGQFRIIRELGRGGMGIVYEGEQSEPNRRVAIKVVSALGSDDHRRRIAQEAQALAMIEDPGVARIYESGIAEVFGIRTPYIVMELVQGSAIDRWVAENRLGVHDRLLLIARIADAVQTAHSRGVTHRDLKPSNILVIPQRDGPGQPKVVDFGIAQLRSSELTMQTLLSQESGPVGTLQFMSPEQLGDQHANVNASSDIYSLGSVAYTVLTGAVPHDLTGTTLARSAMIIAEHQPRSIGSLERSCRGDIEIVISKAMEKEASRRYHTMEAFSADLRRILNNEPVLARRPSLPYKVKKFTQRNTIFTGSLAVVAALVAISFIWISHERSIALTDSKTSSAVSGFMVEMFSSIEPNLAHGDEVTVRMALDDAAKRLDADELKNQPEIDARLRIVLGRIYGSLGEYDQSIKQIQSGKQRLVSIHGMKNSEVAQAFELLAQMETRAGKQDDAEQHFLLASSILKELGLDSFLISSDGSLGHVYYWAGRYEESEEFFRNGLELLKDKDPAKDARVGHTLSSMGSVMEAQGKLDDAIAYHQRGVAAQSIFYGERHTKTAEAYNDMGNTLLAAGVYEDSLEAHLHCLSIRESLLDQSHPDMAVSMNNIAITYIRLDQAQKAIPLLQRAIDIRLETFGRFHQSTCSSYGNLARAYMQSGDLKTALSRYDEAIDAAEQTLGPEHMMSIVFRSNKGECLMRMERFDEAETTLLSEYATAERVIGGDHFRCQTIARLIAELYIAKGEPTATAIWEVRSGQSP